MPVFLRYAVPSTCVVGGWPFAVLDSNVKCTADGRERLTLGPTVLSTVDIADAAAEQTTTGYAIRLEFTAEGQRRWEDVTREKVGQFIAFLVDDELLAAPQITQPLTGDSAQLPGPFTSLDQARKVADAIRGN
ncbi:SecDF P1 head subdomain-containing protein [Lentzea alba]